MFFSQGKIFPGLMTFEKNAPTIVARVIYPRYFPPKMRE
jgi:hypothetical protein